MNYTVRKESADDYTPVLYQNGRYRVIECRDGIQWVIQKAKKTGRGREWRGFGYCRTSAALIGIWSACTGETAPPELDCLPDRIEGGLAR
ncbi:MAG: hypothetical protein MnENMB40S_28720 [Rhizobiaceae bacterium MnEN-MB40S]|nr:MAG: hypothetical protein MnENMB40S_28720 [Rhizobiaceae bacterium MnEN-MB40S]